MAIVTPGRSETPWSQVFDPITQILTQKVNQHRQQQQQMQQAQVIDQLLSALPQNASPVDFMRAFAQAQGKGVSQESIKPYQEAIPKYQEQQNKQLELGRKQQEAQLEKEAASEPFKNMLGLISRGREIQESGHLGPKFSAIGTSRKAGSTLSPEGQRLRSEYRQIGKALVQAAAPLKITNRSEFEHYAKDLENPHRTNEEIKGSLDALERIVRQHLPKESEGETSPDILGRTQNMKTRKVRHKTKNLVREVPLEELREYLQHPEFELADEQNQ